MSQSTHTHASDDGGTISIANVLGSGVSTAFLASANVFTNAQRITPATDVVGLIIDKSTTANALTVQTGATVLANIDFTGRMTLTPTIATATTRGLVVNSRMGASSGNNTALELIASTTNAGTTPNALIGVSGGATHAGSGNPGFLIGVQGTANLNAAVTAGDVIMFHANMNITNSGTFTRLFGLKVGVITGGSTQSIVIGTVTNAYGVYINPVTGASTLNYSIYTNAATDGARFGHQLVIDGSTDVNQLKVTGFTTQAVATPLVQFTRNDAAAGVSSILRLTALGSLANGDGGSLELRGKSSTTADTAMGMISYSWVDVTHLSRKADVILSVFDTAVREGIRIRADGTRSLVGIATAAPTARLHLPAGGTAANTAPLKFTTQAAALTSVEQGTMELVGNSLQFTQLAKRRGVVMSQSTMTASFTLVSSAAESAAIITAEHGANYAEVGKMEEIRLFGTIQKDVGTPTNTLTVRVKYAGATVQTIVSDNTSIAAGTPVEILVVITFRTIGGTGTMQVNSKLMIDGVTNVPDSATLVSPIDTTTAQNTTITAQFTNSSATNNLVIHQGRVLCIEPNR